MFELRYQYVCSAGWMEEKAETVDNYDDLDAALNKCKRNGYTVLDNRMCTGCRLFPETCAGTRNHIWTGCSRRQEREDSVEWMK